MIEILEAYSIPLNPLWAIEAIFTGTKARVVTPDGTTDKFELLAGVLQGGTLASFLFPSVLALRKTTGNHEELGLSVNPRSSSRTITEKILQMILHFFLVTYLLEWG